MKLEETIKVRVESEQEAQDLIDRYYKDSETNHYTVKKASCDYKNKKSKGEIIAEAWVVTVTLVYASLWALEE